MRIRRVTDEYIALVCQVNEAKTTAQHHAAQQQLRGFCRCLKALDWTDYAMGCLVMAADNHYIRQGIDRPMTGGVFHDWQPEETAVLA